MTFLLWTSVPFSINFRTFRIMFPAVAMHNFACIVHSVRRSRSTYTFVTSDAGSQYRCTHFSTFRLNHHRRNNKPTDQRTDKASNRVACPQLKKNSRLFSQWCMMQRTDTVGYRNAYTWESWVLFKRDNTSVATARFVKDPVKVARNSSCLQRKCLATSKLVGKKWSENFAGAPKASFTLFLKVDWTSEKQANEKMHRKRK